MNRPSLCLVLLALLPTTAGASERHFTYSYESPLLQSGEKELETYSTFKFGRPLFYSALDQRIEFEMGLGDGVQTSLYLNFEQEMADDGAGNVSSSFLADGISSEWKFKLADSLTEDFGLGLYLEAGFKPDELELETKIILDKRAGNWLATFNLTNEPELHLLDNSIGYSLVPSFGVGFFLVPEKFFLGVEVENENFYDGNNLQITRSLLSAGPCLSYTGEDWWATLTFLPQLVNLMGGPLDLTESQRFQIRLAVSISLPNHPVPATSSSAALPVPVPGDQKVFSRTKPTGSQADLMMGRDLLLQRCARCHGVHSPGEFTPEGWEKIMERMKVKAHLDEGARESILGYLSFFAKEGK